MQSAAAMIETDFQSTPLWRTAFAADYGHNNPQRDRLARLTLELRDNVRPLIEQTARTLPQLTDHSGFHVDQLWEVASTICGESYPLNPLEGFFLGAAFAFHDAALTVEAYDGGLAALQTTPQWRDAVARTYQAFGNDEPTTPQLEHPPAPIVNAALFTLLRLQHAREAEKLAFKEWKHPATKGALTLFPDARLRDDYGRWIGLVAASHHWPIAEVGQRLARTLPQPTGYPPEWNVDLAKLACILRCADAAAIDDRRAPARLFAIRQPEGHSRMHWAFQDNLFPVTRQGEALTFKSKRPFGAELRDEWWLAHDAIGIVSEELQASNALLAAAGRQFAARFVAGAHDPAHLKTLVEVEGWEPVDTRVRVPDVPTLVERLGGWQLYGTGRHAAIAPVRELIQNACDAIRARRALAAANPGPDPAFVATPEARYPGRVIVRFDAIDGNQEKMMLSVEDDGIGMPAEVLTGGLLSFGTSFWKSEAAGRLYPGLQSSAAFRPAGKFGLGFFSVFMLSRDVTVVSAPWDAGARERRTVAFERGLNFRALFRPYDAGKDGAPKAGTVTWVRMPVEVAPLADAALYFTGNVHREPVRGDSLKEALGYFLRCLCFALDVRVDLAWEGGTAQPVNHPYYADWTAEEFRQRLDQTFGDEERNYLMKPEEMRLLAALRDDDGTFCGRVATRLAPDSPAGRRVVDGFTSSGEDDYHLVGLAEYRPAGAARSTGHSRASPEAWRRWAADQVARVGRMDLDPWQRYSACLNLSEYGVDLRPICAAEVNGAVLPLEAVLDAAIGSGRLQFVVRHWGPEGDYSIVRPEHMPAPGKFAAGELTISATGGAADFFFFLEQEPPAPDNLFDCIRSGLNARGYTMTTRFAEKVCLGHYNEEIPGGGSVEREVREDCLVCTLHPLP